MLVELGSDINVDVNVNEHTDYGIVGDLFEVVPLLTEEFKKVLVSCEISSYGICKLQYVVYFSPLFKKNTGGDIVLHI